jgi:hypothetical protein
LLLRVAAALEPDPEPLFSAERAGAAAEEEETGAEAEVGC